MSTFGQQNGIDFTVDTNNLYREEGITDLKVASIRRLIPIKIDGSDDETREPIYVGHTQLMSPSGPVPIQSALEAKDLEAAVAEFPGAMNKTVEQLIEDAKKHQQQEDSRIVVPGRETGSNIIM